MTRTFVYILTILILYSCKDINSNKTSRFVEHHLPFQNNLTATTNLNILNYLYYYNGAGVSIEDFNNDSLLDILLISNQEDNQLFLNKGNLSFEQAFFPSKPEHSFSTGVTTVDINNDGLMDIYISQVSTHLALTGKNLLYINLGDKNGTPSFKEQAKEYGLDLSGLYSQASFFDYDLDGDLDVYLLKHSVHPNSNYNRGSTRYKTDPEHGDQLLQNNNGFFTDVSQKAGILQNKISYGLGIGISDLTNDGYPDIYIGNDFFENDYLYINNADGTFSEINTLQNALGHTTHFSMGNDLADLNNDGYTDILSVDMLPEDIKTLKAAGTEYGFPIYQNNLRNGYQPQYMQNTLHLNLGNSQFTETAFASGIAATEWSWSPLAADFDNDGLKDVHITNGIVGATNDMDFVNFISNEEIQKKLGTGMDTRDLELIKKIPPKITPNYFYKNKGNNTFYNVTKDWFHTTPSISHGAAYGDLDKDGDLDLVINNVNAPAQILENRTQEQDSTNFLKIKFKGTSQNINAIGAKVLIYKDKDQQILENYNTRGYLSSTASSLHFGVGATSVIDSLRIIWPSGQTQKLTKIRTNQTIFLDITDTIASHAQYQTVVPTTLLSKIPNPIDFIHKDATSLDFNRDPLIPYANSNMGPQLVTGDLNDDGLDDVVALGAKTHPTQIYYQTTAGTFTSSNLDSHKEFDINEDVSASIFDANNDGRQDVIIVSGGNEFTKGKPLQPRLYIQENGGLRFRESIFSTIAINASKVVPIDIDNDGDLDLSILSNSVPREFGAIPKQYLFINDGKGNFTEQTANYSKEFQNLGNVYDIVWEDMNDNGYKDAIAIGHWMAPTLFLNNGKHLTKQNTTIDHQLGWWNTIGVADFDKDGDIDMIVGNWGDNTRLRATEKEPVQLYRNDFDNNDRIDPIVTYFYQGTETTIATKDELVKQLPFINKKFLSYNDFARADLTELLPKKLLKEAEKKKVTQLSSMYFENDGTNNFTARKLPFLAQLSSIKDILIDDYNDDDYPDVFIVGNDFEISTQLGRLDGLKGLLLLNNKQGFFNEQKQQNFNISGAARSIAKLEIKGKTHYIVGINNDAPLFLQKAEE